MNLNDRSSTSPPAAAADALRESELQQIREALQGLRFGSVNVIVQDGLVIQIDRTEKKRLRRGAAEPNR